MSNKKILAELKMCYEYLLDINKNEKEQLRYVHKKDIENMEKMISDIYSYVWENAFPSGDLFVEEDEELGTNTIIGKDVNNDYSVQDVETGEFEYSISGNWYYEELELTDRKEIKDVEYGYELMGKGLMKALDEISRLSEKCGEEFDYYDKAQDLLETCNSNTLYFLDEFGSDNE